MYVKILPDASFFINNNFGYSIHNTMTQINKNESKRDLHPRPPYLFGVLKSD